MRMALRLTSYGLSLLLGYAAHAQQIEVGTSLVCDTAAQVERMIAIYDGDIQSAAEQVDAEEHDPPACVMSAVDYIRGPALRAARKGNVSFQIVPILINARARWDHKSVSCRSAIVVADGSEW
jgi:hypothetical protein